MTSIAGAARPDGERLEVVRTAGRLQQIGGAWEALWDRARALVFQSHGWVSAWWGALPDPERRELFIVLAWRGDTLEAVLPLAICRLHGVRVLEWAAKDYTDYCDALLQPGADPAEEGEQLEQGSQSSDDEGCLDENRFFPGVQVAYLTARNDERRGDDSHNGGHHML